jgi:hypothetical protein
MMHGNHVAPEEAARFRLPDRVANKWLSADDDSEALRPTPETEFVVDVVNEKSLVERADSVERLNRHETSRRDSSADFKPGLFADFRTGLARGSQEVVAADHSEWLPEVVSRDDRGELIEHGITGFAVLVEEKRPCGGVPSRHLDALIQGGGQPEVAGVSDEIEADLLLQRFETRSR